MIIKQPQALEESKNKSQERQRIRSTKAEARSVERPTVGILIALFDSAQQSIFSTSSLRFITLMFKSHTLMSSLLQELFHHIQHTLNYSLKTSINLLRWISFCEFTHKCIINWYIQVTINFNNQFRLLYFELII